MSRDRLREKYIADVVRAFDTLPREARFRLAANEDLTEVYHSLAWLSAHDATKHDLSWMRRNR